jgi:hypothetical protein
VSRFKYVALWVSIIGSIAAVRQWRLRAFGRRLASRLGTSSASKWNMS